MKTLFVLLIAIFLFITYSFAQQEKDTISLKKYNHIGFLYIIHLDNNKTIISQNVIISPSQCKSFEIISRFDCISRFGIFTPSGAGIIKLNPNTKMILFNQILDKFHIKKENISKVWIDDMNVENPETIIATDEGIMDVKIMSTTVNNYEVRIITPGHLKNSNSLQPEKRKILLNPQEVVAIENYLNN
ncbi:hypothetical protein KXD93_24690 [Mucilaginibacter sp. BJC16-A38]|uniref:hypothetical protein n=1 Tax=Mucilaginibacter phenanthrenivorans TaxID=1234842 RepID=UPI0021587F09|nr:hypothetical protein [Mucilaginibacter phenanthrenivorans]MCR8560878.1 hypothetical protein [Mucilaginibacter phenanthrenivorans]